MGALGAFGAGHVHQVGDAKLTFMPWTQQMMDAFEDWLVGRLTDAAMSTAEVFRKKARKLLRDANALREQGMANVGVIGAIPVSQEDFDDAAGEAQALQLEAREMVNRIGENRAMGLYHFFGLLARESRDQVNGRVKIAHLMLLPKQPNITLAEVELLARPGPWKQLGEAIAEANEHPKKAPPSPVASTPIPALTTSATTSTTPDPTALATTPA